MTDTLSIFVAGEPKGRAHTRAFLVHRKGTQEPQAISAPQSTKEQRTWLATVKDAMRQAVAANGWEKRDRGAIWLQVLFVMPRPQAFYWKNPHEEPYCWRLPDKDNLVKAILDCATGILWRDDAQVAESVESKRYARPGEGCGVKFTMRFLGEWMKKQVNATPKTLSQ